MAKVIEKRQARTLRRKGESLSYIAVTLGVSKSSVSYWCRDIAVPRLARADVISSNRRAGQLKGANANRKKKEKEIQAFTIKGTSLFSHITKRELLVAGAAFYWGEGGKTQRWSFSNSDPEAILFMRTWLENAIGVSKKRLVPRVLINEMHAYREREVINFWSSYLDIPVEQFKSTTFVHTKVKKVYENHDSYYGVMMLRVTKSTSLLYETLGLIEGLKNSTIPRKPA